MDINERIKELQKDSKFFFKQTEEIIDIVYRLAVQDCNCKIPPKDFTDEISEEINNKIVDNVIFNVKEDKGRNLKEELDDALNVIKSQDEKIKEQEKTIKELNSQIYDLKQNKKKSFPKKSEESETPNIMNNQFQSGMVSGLKYSILIMEGNNYLDAFEMIVKKYNEVCKPQQKYWP